MRDEKGRSGRDHKNVYVTNITLFDIPFGKGVTSAYNTQIINNQTVEAEITAMMPLQRACDAENQARNKLSNGPLRAQSNVTITKYSATCGHTSVAGDMSVSC